MYTSLAQFPVKDIVDLINSPAGSAVLEGYKVKVSGVRLNTFAKKGTSCICCGAVGDHFKLETNNKNPTQGLHLNLYARNSNGHYVLMTRDHIVLKSKGGENTVENMNPMCLKCNNKRGNRYESLEKFLKENKVRD